MSWSDIGSVEVEGRGKGDVSQSRACQNPRDVTRALFFSLRPPVLCTPIPQRQTSNRKTVTDGSTLVAADNDTDSEQPHAAPKQKRARKITDTLDGGENFPNQTTSSKNETRRKVKPKPTVKQTDDSAASSARTRNKRALPVDLGSDSTDSNSAFYQEAFVPKAIKKLTAAARGSKAKKELSLRAISKSDPPLVGHAITKPQWLLPWSYGEGSAKTQSDLSKSVTGRDCGQQEEGGRGAQLAQCRSLAVRPLGCPDHRLLVLTGPAGSGKTAVLRMLSVEMHFDIIEWSNPYNENLLTGGAGTGVTRDDEGGRNHEDYVPVLRKFQEFLSRAHKYPSLVMTDSLDTISTANRSLPASLPTNDSLSNSRKLILIEDVPNISSLPVKKLFHSILRSFLCSPRFRYPIALVLSDASVHHAADTDLSSLAQRREHDSFMDARTVVPPDVLNARGCYRVQFNPIAFTFMVKALGRVAAAEFAGTRYLEEVAETSNGDIRSAMNTLQFLSLGAGEGGDERRAEGWRGGAKNGTTVAGGRKRRKIGKNAGGDADGLLYNQSTISGIHKTNFGCHIDVFWTLFCSTGKVGGRESSLALFHALGKILYNKRIGDPGEDEQDCGQEDVALPWPLPDHMAEFRRPLMKSNPEASILYLFSSARRYIIFLDIVQLPRIPVDPDIFTLYLHQNYLNFTTEVEEFVTASDWFSTADYLVKTGGWENSNISSQYAALLSTRGLMFSHTCPVPRLQQKVYKPEYWEMSRILREKQDGIRDLMQCLGLAGEGSAQGRGRLRYVGGVRALELGELWSDGGDTDITFSDLWFSLSRESQRFGVEDRSLTLPGRYQQATSATQRFSPHRDSYKFSSTDHLNFLHSLSSYTTNRFHRPATESLSEKDDGFGRTDEEDGLEGERMEAEAGWNAGAKVVVDQAQEMLFLPEDDIEDF
ncbi:Rad17 cell cycle checkpoint protein-domain-containing protein [Endogone sp. FLAS-F59071]|nr:Rad17 cell cycle checkpoint protein-domain-containing protein [Endogone sp. FLAS-F59071]|eukprot:RUS21356.1 Rad17 cell cycle checkpoint protein-domain-containing protein [Endogone sp. FLAS-F59071]